jgi:hypothetical protein
VARDLRNHLFKKIVRYQWGMSSYKAQAMAQNVADELAKRLTTMLPVTLGVTSGGDISVSCGDGTAGDKNASSSLPTFRPRSRRP